MRRRLVAVAAVAALASIFASVALAHDCIRVSSSLRGLQQSTANGGNWLLFDFSSAESTQATFERVTEGGQLPIELAACVADAYAESGVTPYFALGVGVAGGKKEDNGGFGVLAWHNKNGDTVMADAKGIDHLESSPVGAALFGSLEACGIEVDEE